MTPSPEAVMKEAVRTYWEAQPCGTFAGTGAAHTQAWFDEIEDSRYRREPFIHSFAQFTRWRGQSVLEIGCGAGTDSVQFARAGAQLHAVDLTQAGVELTQRRIMLEGLTADVRFGDAEQLPFADDEFDLVYSWGVLHHTPNTQAALAQVRRVLKAGGRFVIMLYNRHSLVALRMWVARALLAGKTVPVVLPRACRECRECGYEGVHRERVEEDVQSV